MRRRRLCSALLGALLAALTGCGGSAASQIPADELAAQLRAEADEVMPVVLAELGGMPSYAFTGPVRCGGELFDLTWGLRAYVPLAAGDQRTTNQLQDALVSKLPGYTLGEYRLSNGTHDLYLYEITGEEPEAPTLGMRINLQGECLSTDQDGLEELILDPGPQPLDPARWRG